MYNCRVFINRTHSTKLNAHSTNEMPIVLSVYSGKQKTYLFQLHDVSVVQGCLWSTAWFPSLVLPMTKSVFLDKLFSPFAVLCHCWSTASLAWPIASWFQDPVLFSFFFFFSLLAELFVSWGEGGGEREKEKVPILHARTKKRSWKAASWKFGVIWRGRWSWLLVRCRIWGLRYLSAWLSATAGLSWLVTLRKHAPCPNRLNQRLQSAHMALSVR